MVPNLDSLELPSDEQDAARQRIRGIAYEKWRAAGCPDGMSLSFWLQAERDWIEHEFVPHRNDK